MLRWQHNKVLRKLAEVVEKEWWRLIITKAQQHTNRSGSSGGGEPADTISRRPAPKLLTLRVEWEMDVDLGRQLHFPGEICSTTLQPDMVLWTAASKSVQLVKQIVAWEERRKKAKYSNLTPSAGAYGSILLRWEPGDLWA